MLKTMKPRLEDISPTLGSFVLDIDLADEMAAEVIDDLRVALHTRGVLVFPDQDSLTAESQIRFAAQFGPLWIHPYGRKHPEHPELLIFDETGTTQIIGWHADGTFDERPIYGSVLRAVKLPANGGGDTLWASGVAAFDGLSPQMQRFVADLSALHAISSRHTNGSAGYDGPSDEVLSTIHPVVKTDPITNRQYLFVNPWYTTRIVDLPPHESEAILAFLFRHITSPNYQIRVKWQPGMVVFWNNLLTQHFATNDYLGYERTVHRATIGGDVLVGLSR